jgi:hypothetical protein
MPLLGVLSILLQIFCVVHVIRNGRDQRWMYFIVLVPGIGCAAYFLTEILPGLRHDRQLHRAKKGLFKAIDPLREVRAMRDNLETANTQANRLALADACLQADCAGEAVELYQRCLQAEAHNPALMEKLAQAHFALHNYAQAKQTLAELIQHNPKHKSCEGHLLYARSLEALADIPAATQEYRVLCDTYPGEEARVRYALMLKTHGDAAEAAKICSEVVRRTGRAPKYYRRVQKAWIDIAKQQAG